MHKKRSIGVCLSSVLLFLTCLSVMALTLPSASAEESVVTEVQLSVPISCSMSGTGMESHNAEVVNGRTQENIGLTTIKAYCNDPLGFAIYAIGYTDNTYGKTVLTDSELGSTYDIATSSTVVDATSSWSMKLAAVSGTYAPIIAGSSTDTLKQTGDPDFSDYTAVPEEYTKVAYRAASTDIGTSATGSSVTTTYKVHISPTQAAGTYVGQVKYTLVHPSFVTSDAFEDAVTVNFNGNGLTFPDGSSTNQVKYTMVCKPGGYGYVGSNYQEVMTSNITTGGTQSGPYTDSESVLQTLTLPNADKVKVVVEYGITSGSINLAIAKGTSAVPPEDAPAGSYEEIYAYDDVSGTKSFIFEGDTVTINIESWDTPATGYDKGFYVKVYPVYDTEQANTTRERLPDGECSIRAISGNYTETTEWYGKWTAVMIDGYTEEFEDVEPYCDEWSGMCSNAETAESQIIGYIGNNYDLIKGSSLTLNAFKPVTFDEVYASANKVKLNGYYKIQDFNASMCHNVSEGQITTVIDVRDNNLYNIGKYSNDDCWLLENLRLDPTNSTTAANMSSSNTNASDDAIYNYLHGGNPNSISGWTSNAVSSPNDWQPINNMEDPFIHNSNNNSYGIYYNYCAATAGTYCYSQNSYNDANSDICPVNWALPTRNQLNNMSRSFLNPGYAGEYMPGTQSDTTDSLEGEGVMASYWSSTRANDFMMKNAWCYNNNSKCYDPYGSTGGNGMPRYDGLSIRCVISGSPD